MAACALHLLLILLAFSCIVPLKLNAVAMTRTVHLFHGSREIPALKDINEITAAEIAEEELANRRMDFESNDYPGTGANNRHTPKPPLGRD